jgi:hypothetical protein
MPSTSDFLSCPVSKVYNLDDLRYVKQYRRVGASEQRLCVAIDTETFDGNIIVLADNDGNFIEYPNITFENVAHFLFQHEYKWIFCWNLSYDGDVIAKLLGDVLYNYKYSGSLNFTYKDKQTGKAYRIRYIENKSLTISKGHHSVTVYDIAQYFDKSPLDKAYTSNLKLPLPSDYVAMKAKRSFFTLRYYRDHKKLVRNYYILDCIHTKALADYWINIFHQAYGFYPNRWLSAGYLAEKVMIANGINVPYFYDIEYPIQKLARASFYGGRFEMLMKGFVGKAYDYDINSAYPYALTNVPDLTQGRWIDSEEIHPDAKLGFFHIVANVPSSVRVAPFPFRTKWGMIFYPFGKFETYVTLPELLAVRSLNVDAKIGFRILEGYQFLLSNNDDSRYIFKDFISDQYRKRQQLKLENSPLERTIKLILNSMYRKMAQKTKIGRGKALMGNLFCPVIASHVTGYARAQLLSLTHNYGLEQDLVAYATDSITTKKALPSVLTNDLGGLKLAEQSNDMFSIQNGFRRSNGKWKLRGLGYDKEKKVEIEHIDTLETRDGRVVLVLERKKPQRLKSAILRGKLNDIGKFRTFKREIDLNADTKRFWPQKLDSVLQELCVTSAPLDINLDAELYVSKSEISFYAEGEEFDPSDQ